MAADTAGPLLPAEGIVELVDSLIRRGLDAGASDMHFEPTDDELLVRVRIDGRLRDFENLPRQIADNVVGRLKVISGLLTYRMDIPQEGSVRWPDGPDVERKDQTDLRVATFPTIRGERAVVRVFRARSPVETLDALGLPADQVEQLRRATRHLSGLVPVTGPAGSGKSTTLYAMIRQILDESPDRSVVTLEDPVEQKIARVAQIQINPYGELNYDRCLRSLLRQDPQVVLLGEIRDAHTASIAVEASLTGHLILTTMHSGDPAQAIVRLLDMEIAAYQVVSAVSLVCSQRLLRRRVDGVGEEGYAGRVACAELTAMDDDLRELILAKPSVSRLRKALRERTTSIHDQARKLVEQGVTDMDEVRRVLGDPD